VKDVKSWSDIGEAWKNDDSVDTAKKLYEIVHATFDDNSGFEMYMESKIMNRLELKYNDDSLRNKGCIARMVMTRKSELNKLINKRTECTHQKKISSKRLGKIDGNRNSKGTFTIKGPEKCETYNRDGSICGTKGSGEINRFDNYYYMEMIRNLQQEKNKLAKQLQEQTKSNDVELLQEKNRNVTEIVKDVSKKKKPARKKPKITENETNTEPVVNSDYVKMVQEKKKRNKRKLQDLGLVPNTPTPNCNSQDTDENTPKQVEKKKTARRKLMQSPRQSAKAKSMKSGKNMKVTCPFDHKLYGTNYCEENDKRYVEQDYDLRDVKCQGCKKCFFSGWWKK